MADTYTTTLMKLVIPTPGERQGPLYASDINTIFDTGIDSHDHTPDKGARVPVAGMSWNADFNAASTGTAYSVTSLKSSNYTAQSSNITAARSTWFKTDNNYYVTDGSGNVIQITAGGTLNTGAIVTNVYSPMSTAGNHTIGASDTYTHVRCSPSGGGLTITLPAANAVTNGRYYVISDVNGTAASNNITITRAGSDTIEGATTYVLNNNYGSAIIGSEGTANRWKIIATNRIPSTPVTNVYESQTVSGNVTIGSSDTPVHYRVSPPGGGCTITLPLSSAVTTGRFYVISDVAGTAASNNITISRAGSDTIDGANTYVINVNRGAVVICGEGASNRWKVVGSHNTSGADVITSDASGAIINAAQLEFASNYTSTLWGQRQRLTNGAGANMTLQAQDGLGTNQNGGHIYIISGVKTGTGTDGRVLLATGNNGSTIDIGDLGPTGSPKRFMALFSDGVTTNLPSTGDRYVYLQDASTDPGTPLNGFVIWSDSSANQIAFKGDNGHRVSFSGFTDTSASTGNSGPTIPSSCMKWWRVNLQGTTYRIPAFNGT